jgi:hypothetical protein
MASKAVTIGQALCLVDVTIIVEKDLRLLLVGAGLLQDLGLLS